MDSAGQIGGHIDELVLVHVLGRPVGKLDDEADLGDAGGDVEGSDLLAVFFGEGDVHAVLTVIPEPDAPAVIGLIGAVVVEFDDQMVLVTCQGRYGQQTQYQEQSQAQCQNAGEKIHFHDTLLLAF